MKKSKMKALIYLLAFMSLSSCLTVKRIEKNCDKFAKICITETKKVIEYRDTTIYVDRIVTVPLPKDTVMITDTVRIINNRCYLPVKYKEFGLVWARASVDNSILNVHAGLTDSTILVPVHDTVFLDNAITSTTTDSTITLPPEKFIPGFYKFTFWAFIILAVVGIGYLVLRFTTLRLPFVRKV
ncbi:MAG: hypothetical protein HQ522_16170 [Bacteroidetes bacterium]|nr:hypothetical protein [Bacteroidota bacterium]